MTRTSAPIHLLLSHPLGALLLLLLLGAELRAQPLAVPGGDPLFEVKGATEAEPLLRYRTSAALVIGQSSYPGDSLPTARTSAERLASALRERAFRVVFRADQGEDALRQSLESFFLKYGTEPEARLIVYFAGHAAVDDQGELYLIPANQKVPANGAPRSLVQPGLTWRELVRSSQSLPARHILFILDACYSGAAIQPVDSQPQPTLLPSLAQKVRLTLTSTSADQRARDETAFVSSLLLGLQGSADFNHDSYVTGHELAHYTVLASKDSGQSPQFAVWPPDSAGDIVFSTTSNVTATLTLNAVPAAQIFLNGNYLGGSPVEGRNPQAETALVRIQWSTGEWVERTLPITQARQLSCVGVNAGPVFGQSLCCWTIDAEQCSTVLMQPWSSEPERRGRP